MSENLTERDRSRHVDVQLHFLRDLVRDDHVKLVKCAGTQNVSDAFYSLRAWPEPRSRITGTYVGTCTLMYLWEYMCLFLVSLPLSYQNRPCDGLAFSCQSSFLLVSCVGKRGVGG
jgi:hypothetical protein